MKKMLKLKALKGLSAEDGSWVLRSGRKPASGPPVPCPQRGRPGGCPGGISRAIPAKGLAPRGIPAEN